MRKLFVIISIFVFSGLTSCELFDDLIPDVDTEYSKTFSVLISQNQGETESELVDITDSDEYEDFKDNIKGYEINKITYEITENNVPDNMYFSGSVKCQEFSGTGTEIVGNITNVNIQSVASSGEIDVEKLPDRLDDVVKWLDTPGKFYLNAMYTLKDNAGSPYPLDGTEGYGFKLKLKFYVTVKTGA